MCYWFAYFYWTIILNTVLYYPLLCLTNYIN